MEGVVSYEWIQAFVPLALKSVLHHACAPHQHQHHKPTNQPHTPQTTHSLLLNHANHAALADAVLLLALLAADRGLLDQSKSMPSEWTSADHYWIAAQFAEAAALVMSRWCAHWCSACALATASVALCLLATRLGELDGVTYALFAAPAALLSAWSLMGALIGIEAGLAARGAPPPSRLALVVIALVGCSSVAVAAAVIFGGIGVIFAAGVASVLVALWESLTQRGSGRGSVDGDADALDIVLGISGSGRAGEVEADGIVRGMLSRVSFISWLTVACASSACVLWSSWSSSVTWQDYGVRPTGEDTTVRLVQY